MKFLVLSIGGDGIGLCLRLMAEGNEVRLWVRESEADRGEGIIERAKDSSWGQIVVADCTGFGPILDSMVANGTKVVGGSSLADRLEADRDFASEVMERCGILQPESKSFNDWDSAVEFISSTEDRLVFKPEGSLSGVIPSYTPSSNEELLESIPHFKKLCGENCPQFTLQKFTEGIAVSTEGWFDGEKFLEPFNHTIERKHFLNGDLGPSGGCSGNVVWPVSASDQIVRETVLRLSDFLREHQYRGAIDVNAIINEEGAWGLEFTPRFGYDAFPTYLYSLYTGDFGSLLWDMATGQGKEMEVADKFAAGVRISIPPWPTEKYSAEEGIPIRGISQYSLFTDFCPYDLKLQNDSLVTSGGAGIVGVMNSSGNTVGEAFARVYQKIVPVKIPDMQYRTDLGEVCSKDYRELDAVLTSREDMGWIGVDLDGTLAKHHGARRIGEPIPEMVDRIKRWVREGKEVRILTARADPKHEQLPMVYDWLNEHIGLPIEVTNKKDHEMKTLYDDRVKQVEKNTGELVA